MGILLCSVGFRACVSQSGYLPQAHGGSKGLSGRTAVCKDSAVHRVFCTLCVANTRRNSLAMVSILMEDFLM